MTQNHPTCHENNMAIDQIYQSTIPCFCTQLHNYKTNQPPFQYSKIDLGNSSQANFQSRDCAVSNTFQLTYCTITMVSEVVKLVHLIPNQANRRRVFLILQGWWIDHDLNSNFFELSSITKFSFSVFPFLFPSNNYTSIN